MGIHCVGSHLYKGDQARKVGNYPDALAHFKAHVEDCPEDAFGWRLLGDLYRELDDFSAAEIAYTTAIDCPFESLPDYEQYKPYYGRCLLYQYMGKYRAALGDLGHAQYRAVDEIWYDPYHYRFFNKVSAELRTALGKFEAAVRAYRNYYRQHGRSRTAYRYAPEVQELQARLSSDQIFGALSWSGAVLSAALPDPAVPSPILEAIQAEIWAFGEGQPLLELTTLLPDDARAWRYLGHTYWYSGRDAEAGEAFARACQLAPEAPENLFVQGCLAYFGQNKSQAMQYFNAADMSGLPKYECTQLHQYRSRL